MYYARLQQRPHSTSCVGDLNDTQHAKHINISAPLIYCLEFDYFTISISCQCCVLFMLMHKLYVGFYLLCAQSQKRHSMYSVICIFVKKKKSIRARHLRECNMVFNKNT
jgi:hypothetical protein